MNFLYYLVTNSLVLDYKFITTARLEVSQKIEFLVKKYQIIFRHFVLRKKFKLNHDYITLNTRRVFYDCVYGLGGYQRILSSHQHIFDVANLHKADTVIDVGANVGYFTLFCQNLFPQATIYSFEPGPDAFAALQKNCTELPNLHLYQSAVSNVDGTTHIEIDSEISALSRVSDHGNLVINCQTLDSLVVTEKLSSIDLLKIDAEGHEKHILEGAKNALKITRNLFIELTLQNNDNYTFSSVINHLHTPDYEFQLVAYRNMAGTAEGSIPIVELFFKNIKLQ